MHFNAQTAPEGAADTISVHEVGCLHHVARTLQGSNGAHAHVLEVAHATAVCLPDMCSTGLAANDGSKPRL